MPAFSRSELPELQMLVTIARRRSFRRAAIELGLTTSALSHAMKRLEERMGVRLLHRTARSVVPTPIGERLAQRLEQGFEAIGEALGDVESYRQNPAGELRINVPRDGARLLIGPVLPQFAEAFPQVRLSLAVEDRPVDIVAEGFDAGIRYAGTIPEDMVAMPLTGPLRWVVAGSPDYIARHGRPKSPEDLAQHACIRVHLGDGTTFKWELGDGEAMVRLDVQGPLGVNDTESTVQAAANGVGLAYVLERRALEEVARGTLEIVLPEWASTGPGFCAYYASRKQTQPGLRQLIDMVRRREGLA
jgi:DNA-binding transcriptional LysR family regulator